LRRLICGVGSLGRFLAPTARVCGEGVFSSVGEVLRGMAGVFDEARQNLTDGGLSGWAQTVVDATGCERNCAVEQMRRAVSGFVA